MNNHELSNSKKDSITSLSSIFGYMVFKARQLSNKSQVEYASQFGISHTALLKIEKGITVSSLDFLQDFSIITNTTLSEIQSLAEDIILDLDSKGVRIVSSTSFQATCKKLSELYGIRFYEKTDLDHSGNALPSVLMLEPLGRTIDQKLVHRIYGLVGLERTDENIDPKTKKLIKILQSQKDTNVIDDFTL